MAIIDAMGPAIRFGVWLSGRTGVRRIALTMAGDAKLGEGVGPKDKRRPARLAFASTRATPSLTMNEKLLDDLNERISALLRNTPAAEVQKNLKAMLAQALGKMDLVTREEFDIQTQVLARTREKLTALEARLAQVEQRSTAL